MNTDAWVMPVMKRLAHPVLKNGVRHYLAGKPSADLYVVQPDGTNSTRLAHADPQAAYTITTTLDKQFQLLVQKALLGFTGAVVVMEKDTGRILAMASSPSFDPNVFQTDNYNSQFVLGDLVNDPETPLVQPGCAIRLSAGVSL